MAPSIVIPTVGEGSGNNHHYYNNGPPSPTPSNQSVRSFLDEDPYPDGHAPRRSTATVSHPASSQSSHVIHPPPDDDLLAKLEALLNDKANEIHLAGQLGAALLAQQTELEQRIRQLAEVQHEFAARRPAGGQAVEQQEEEEEAVGQETRRRLQALEEDLRKWDEGNAAMYETVGRAAQSGAVPKLDQLLGGGADPATSSTHLDDYDQHQQTTPPRRRHHQQVNHPPDSAPPSQHHTSRAQSTRAAAAVTPFLSQSLAAGPSTTLNQQDPSSSTTTTTGGGGASRRARNTALHRNNDIELATEIGQSLLSEVRRLQALLGEKEEMMLELKREKEALQNEVEGHLSGRRAVEESVEKFKEENWNLELVSQDLRNALTDSQSSLLKAETERTRALKDLSASRDGLEAQRSHVQLLQAQLESLKQKHETDMATMRKHSAALQRDKSDLVAQLEGVQAQLAGQKRAIKRSGSQQGGLATSLLGGGHPFEDEEGLSASDDDDEGDVFGGSTRRRKTGEGFPSGSGEGSGDLFGPDDDGSSLAGSPGPGSFNGHGEEQQSLKAGLAHAQRTIATLRSSLAREKQAKLDLRRQLADAAGASPQSGRGGGGGAWDEDDEDDDDDDSDKDGAGTPARYARGRGRGRGRGGLRGRGGSARGSARGSSSRRGRAAVGVPSRLARDAAAGDISIDSIDEGVEVDQEQEEEESFDQEHEHEHEEMEEDALENNSLFEHQFPGVGIGINDDQRSVNSRSSSFDYDNNSPAPATNPARETRRPGAGSGAGPRPRPQHVSRPSVDSVLSIDMDPAFAHHHHQQRRSYLDDENEDEDGASIRSGESSFAFAPRPGASTLADVLGSSSGGRGGGGGGRPASLISSSSYLAREGGGRPISGIFNDEDEGDDRSLDSIRHLPPPPPQEQEPEQAEKEKEQKVQLIFSDVGTMTDFLPPPPPPPSAPMDDATTMTDPLPVPEPQVITLPAPAPIVIREQIPPPPPPPSAEMATMTDPLPVPEPQVITLPAPAPIVIREQIPPPPPPPSAEMSTMTDPLPEPEPKVVTLPAPAPIIIREQAPLPPPVQKDDAETMTDPLPVPEPVVVTLPAPAPIIIREEAPLPPAPQVEDVGVQTVAEEKVETSDFAGQTDKAETAERSVGTDALPVVRTADMATATDPVATPRGVEMEVQTEPLAAESTPTTIAAPFVAPASPSASSAKAANKPANSMEDRALANQPSLSSLGKLTSFFGGGGKKDLPPPVPHLPQDDTIRSFAGIEGLRSAPDSDVESEGTDRAAGTETETETDVEFEDARESIGAPTPSFSEGHDRSASLTDFQSVRSGVSTFHTAGSHHGGHEGGEDSESEVEILRSSPQRYRSSKNRGVAPPLPAQAQEVVPTGPDVVTRDASMQTEEWSPEPVIVYRTVAAPALPLAAALSSTPASAPSKRDSINTFGRAESRAESPDALDESAAAASAFLGASTSTVRPERPLSPDESFRPESALSSFSQATTEEVNSVVPAPSGIDKGKGLASLSTAGLMGPPPTPSRNSTRAARANNSSIRKSGMSSASSASLRQPPARPTSPPPADLLFRAQSPTFNDDYAHRMSSNGFLAPAMATSRSQGSSSSTPRTSASTQNLRVRPQTSMSMSEYANNQAQKSASKGKQSARTPRQGVSSSAASISDLSMHSDISRRMSMASDRTSDGGFDAAALRTGGDSTDPQVIHAITQTMIGEFLHKYTRRAIGKGISEKRHQRFFWVHPYTKTLYWSSADPGAQSTAQSSAKSVFIEGVRQVLDPNPNPPGLHQGSIIIQTPNREMKITASTRERHDMWFNAINYLLARPDVAPPSTPGPASRSGTGPSSPATQHSRKSAPLDYSRTPTSRLYNLTSQSDSRLTPKPSQGKRMSQSVGRTFKRSGTAAEEYERQAAFGSPRSVRTYNQYIGAEESIEVVDRNEIPDDFDGVDDEYEGLENVRACCGGSHDVGSLSRRGGSHHHHHRKSNSQHSDAESFSTPIQTPSASRVRSKSATIGSFSRRGAPPTSSVASSPQRRKPVPALEPMPNPPLTPLAINTGARRNPSAP